MKKENELNAHSNHKSMKLKQIQDQNHLLKRKQIGMSNFINSLKRNKRKVMFPVMNTHSKKNKTNTHFHQIHQSLR